MTPQNQYDHLKADRPGNVEPVEATSSWTITDSRAETITITDAVLPDGSWVYGYIVHWSKGGTSSEPPTTGHGTFRTQRDAKLHAVGFMKMFLPHFTPDTQDAIRRAEKHLLQGQLFD